MRPYYEDGSVTLYCARWEDVQLPPCDLVLTDPPYGISYRKGEGGGRGAYGGSEVRRNRDAVEGDDEPFDPSPWLDYPDVILWGANHFAQRLPHGRWIAWNKLGDREPWDSFSDVEFAWRKGRGKDRIVSHLWKGLCQAGAGEKRWHPTQKPLAVMQWCVGLAPDAAMVLDPFAGSGTTLLAAKNLGRKAIGVEVEERYCEVAARRLAQGVLNLEAA